MINIIPRDHWEYNFNDLFYILFKLLYSEKISIVITLPEIGSGILTRSGRTALVLAIKALKLPKYSRIGVPLYCCDAVFEAVTVAGCKPFFIDINTKTFCLSINDVIKKRNEFDALIAVHMFGNICDVPAIIKELPGIPVIEDCAQALGSKLHGQMAGTFGNIAFFSYRSGKFLSVGEGGSIYTKSPEIYSDVREICLKLPRISNYKEYLHTIKTFLRSKLRSKPFYGLIGRWLWNIYNKSIDESTIPDIPLSRVYRSDSIMINKRIYSLSAIILKQRAYADEYLYELILEPYMLCYEPKGSNYNRYMFPILFSSTSQRDEMSCYLEKKQIDSGKPYQNIVDIAAKRYGYNGNCPVAEDVSKKILTIPVYYKLREKDIKYIAKCINDGWIKMKGIDYPGKNI